MTTEILQSYAEVALIACSALATLLGFFLGKKRANHIESSVREGLEKNIPELLADYERQKKRAQEYLDKIESILAERDRWRELYNDQASGHDNAQALMMSTIHNLARAYQKATGKSPKLDPMIEAVRTDFVGSHGPLARAQTSAEVEETSHQAKEAPLETSE